jgi:organic radical activating enzyme
MLILQRSNKTIGITDTGSIKTQSNDFRGWYCSSGLTSLHIDDKGEIFGSVCQDGGSIGNVFSGFSLPQTARICNFKNCFCAADINIPKAKTLDSLRELANIRYSLDHLSTFTPTSDLSDLTGLISPRSLNTRDIFSVSWFLGKRCNFNCSYCPSSVHDSTSPHLTLDKFSSAFDELYSSIKHHKAIELTFTGGEPTINPDYIDIVKYAHRSNTRIITITNGTSHIDKLITLLNHGGLTISIHQEFTQLKKTLQKIHRLYDRMLLDNTLTINYMIRPGTSKETEHFISNLPPAKMGYFLYIVPLFDRSNNHSTMDYAKEELSLIRSSIL